MKIKDESSDYVNVFGIYQVNGDTYFYGMPRGYKGLLSYRSKNVEVVNNEIIGRWVYFKNNCIGLYHWALIEGELLDDLLELDDIAYQKFLKILKLEGQVGEKFC